MKQIRKFLLLGLIFALVCSVSYASPPVGIEVTKTEVQKQFKTFYSPTASQDLLTLESVYLIDVGQYRPCIQHENLYYNIEQKIDLDNKAATAENISYTYSFPIITMPGNNMNKMIRQQSHGSKKVAERKHYLYWQGRANRN